MAGWFLDLRVTAGLGLRDAVLDRADLDGTWRVVVIVAGDCERCVELELRFKDPATLNPAATLYVWASHLLRDHDVKPQPREGCEECESYAVNPGGVHPQVWERWRQHHFMSCELAPGHLDQE